MNAAVLAYGIAEGGRARARAGRSTLLAARQPRGALSPFQPSPLDRLPAQPRLDHSPAFLGSTCLTRLLSPYQFNPCNYNPLSRVLEEVVDFDRLRRECGGQAVPLRHQRAHRQGQGLHQPRSPPEAVLASACLPFLFQAVEIDGEPYWDGGYMGNPAIFPLIYHCDSPRRGGRAHQPDRRETSRRRHRDHEPDQRDQLQLVPDARDARDR